MAGTAAAAGGKYTRKPAGGKPAGKKPARKPAGGSRAAAVPPKPRRRPKPAVVGKPGSYRANPDLQTPAAEPAAAPESSGTTLQPFAGASPVQTGSGVVLGILAYAVLANYLQGGTSQVRAWFAAKFLNRLDDKYNKQGKF